jgi:hypothetical protein
MAHRMTRGEFAALAGAGLGVLALGRPVLGADSELIFESSIPSGRPLCLAAITDT